MFKRHILPLAIIALLVAAGFQDGVPVGPPDRPSILPGKSRALITFDVDAPPVWVNGPDMQAFLKSHCIDDGYRIVPSETVFNDDMPEFKKLSDPKPPEKNWVRVQKGIRKPYVDAALPATEAETEKLIGK